MIRFTCSHCGKAMQTAAAAAGKQGRCPFCQTVQAIPSPSEQLAAASVAAVDVASAAMESAAANPAAAAPAKKMYREYTGSDAGKKRSVSVNLNQKK